VPGNQRNRDRALPIRDPIELSRHSRILGFRPISLMPIVGDCFGIPSERRALGAKAECRTS
jgi:hypothetical protein